MAEKQDPVPSSDIEKTAIESVKDERGVTEAILKHGLDADEALQAFVGREGQALELDEATNRRLLRKIDWNIMPLMCVIYGLNYLGRRSTRCNRQIKLICTLRQDDAVLWYVQPWACTM